MATYKVGFNRPILGTTLFTALSRTLVSRLNYAASGSTISPVHLVVAGERLKLFTVGGSTSSGIPGTTYGGIYLTDASGTSHGARVISHIPIVAGSRAIAYYSSAALDFDLTPWAGQYIKPATAGDVNFRRAYSSGLAGAYSTATFPTPFSLSANDANVVLAYMTIEDGPKTINSTNSGANTLNAGAVNTASVTGYFVGHNPVVSGTVGSLALTSVSQATTIATFTIPEPVTGSYWPQPDIIHRLTITDGSNARWLNAVMNSLAGYTSRVLASPDLADPNKIPYWLTSTAEDDDRIMYKTADMTVAADGGISGATLGATTIYYHWRVADSKIYAYEALLGEDGIVTSTGLTVRGLSVSGLGVIGLTVRGL